MADNKNNDFNAKIEEKIAILSEDKKGWTRQINRISYNRKPAVYDLRVFSPQGRFGKGITLNEEAFQKLVKLIKEKY